MITADVKHWAQLVSLLLWNIIIKDGSVSNNYRQGVVPTSTKEGDAGLILSVF
jgi:hypothetical protein